MSLTPADADWRLVLPAAVLALVHPDAPPNTRLAVARGLALLPPRDLIFGLSALCGDAAAELAQTARATLTKMPEALLMPVVRGDTPGLVLAALLQVLATRPVLIEAVVANRNTPDAALCAWAPTAPGPIAEMLAQDQQRCMRCEALVAALSRNSHLLKSSLDKLIDFLVRNGVMVDVPAAAEAIDRLAPSELQEAAAQIVLPPQVQALMVEPAPDLTQPGVQDGDGQTAPSSASEAAAEAAADDEAEPKARLPMLKLVGSLNMAQKIALATKGNKEARSILLRDANRIVAVAAIKNPRITDQEVQAAAKSRSISDEVIRIIANSKDMTRSYGTKLSLVNNPKTPMAVALRFLPLLRGVDLKAVAKSKGLPQGLVAQARKLLLSKDAG